jgi:hypothetical protein
MRTIKILILMFSMTFILVSGCRRGGENETAGGTSQPSEISAYGMTLTQDSPPVKVAEIFIKGLYNKVLPIYSTHTSLCHFPSLLIK